MKGHFQDSLHDLESIIYDAQDKTDDALSALSEANKIIQDLYNMTSELEEDSKNSTGG